MIATPEQTKDTRPDLVGMLPEDADAAVRAHFAARGQPAYRVGQVIRWIYERGALGFAEMTDLPQAERAALAEAFQFTALEPAKVSRSVDGTAKHLWRLADGDLIESVLIPTPTRLTLCISSQAGCAMACTFCATGWAGYRRQLTPGEIVAQFRGARRWAQENGYDDVTNIVFMGMGEPLMNPRALFPTLTILNRGYTFGARRITISTVGVVPGILRLAELPEQYRLAVSLHAPNHELAQVVKEFTAFVNLIPFNPIPGTDWKPSKRARLDYFVERLERQGVTAYVRESRGRDIAAACGQLRAEVTQGRTPVQMGSI
jgi:23S rRNA (adenine2503-C2)-methyltransferase